MRIYPSISAYIHIIPFYFQTYDDLIEKTKAELNKEPDSTPDTRSQTKDYSSVADHSSIKPSAHRYKNSCRHDTDDLRIS